MGLKKERGEVETMNIIIKRNIERSTFDVLSEIVNVLTR